jgi:hypothetical protein
MNHLLRTTFFALVVRPLMMVVLGTNVRRGELLPEQGPAIIVANHNSHLDVFALMNVLGKALPKGEAILVPFFCDLFVGEPIELGLGKKEFMTRLSEAMDELKAEMPRGSWV